ncbi:bifunctional DNA-formamidopyrimidine glycosylase/DNA-(apurinic or apyrimidinic site) lyase [Aliikangiella sp. IMCC44653]
MPELPEVETSCSGIRPYCIANTIVKVEVRQPRLRWPVAADINARMAGLKIAAVKRRGKYILMDCGHLVLMIHLGMSGSLRVVEQGLEASKHDHLDIHLNTGKVLRYNDPRRFGSVLINQEGEDHPLLKKLGVEPLSSAFNEDYLYGIAKQRKVAIKVLIMNSQVVVGVGNIYAQEALFRCGILPMRAANRMSKTRIGKLVAEIKLVLSEAIEAGGSTLKDFTSADGKPGYFQHTHQVYGKAGMPCVNCQSKLKQKVIAQRTTVYCSQCQR